MSDVKLLPKGIADFKTLRRENYYYVDKTMFIPKLENESYMFCVRPGRFGKSLTLSMLECYYDCKMRDEFDELFEGLWIHEHPTANRGKYQVMRLDFSVVGGTIDELKDKFNDYCGMVADSFAQYYEDMYYQGFAQEVKNMKWATSKLNFIDNRAKKYGCELYLIVDEYDNFTNTVLAQHGGEVYRSLTHGEGFYRDIFKIFKPMFRRILMLGVSPVTLDDLTSGYNIATNITCHPFYNTMFGFSETEVRQMFLYYSGEGAISGDIEAMISQMRPWYDNYCFSEERFGIDPKMFNVTMVLYYLQNQIERGLPPKEMLAPNTGTDYNKMKLLVQLDQLTGRRKSIVMDIAEKGFIYGQLVDHFPADRLTDESNFVSLLFYYGMLTITGKRGVRLKLGIPNNNVRKQYYKYLEEEYNRIHHVDITPMAEAFDAAAYDGEWRPMLQLIADAYEENTAVRQLIEGERNLQGFFTAYLALNDYYLVAPEVELNHGYCEFFLMPNLVRVPDMEHSYILELKYLKADDSEATAQQQWDEAETQLRSYAQGGRVPVLVGPTKLHLIRMQFRAHKLVRMEEIESV